MSAVNMVDIPEVSLSPARPRSGFGVFRFLFRRDPLAAGLVILFFLTAVFGPLVAPHDPNHIDLLTRLQPPNGRFLLGTDDYGRDILSRLLSASRVALEASVLVILIGGVAGTAFGAVAGLVGGLADEVISRISEIIQGFPTVLLAIAIVAIAGPSLLNAMLAVGIAAVPRFLRVARGLAIQLKAREFIEAARSIGASPAHILWREIMPNMWGALLVIASFESAQAVMYEATLSFLGLGVQPPQASFGGMLSEAKGYLAIQPLYALVVGVVLAAVILGLNLFGDVLGDYYERSSSDE